MKTYNEWESSGVDLDKYLTGPCEVDEEIYLYIVEFCPPTYDDGVFVQSGEATGETKIYGTFTFDTFQRKDGRYFYLGVLPAFKGSEYDYYDKIDKLTI